MRSSTASLRLEVGELNLDTGELRSASGAVARLTPKERGLLAYLAARPREVVSRESLLVDVWGYAPGVVSRAVDKTMARLRGKVERTPAEPRHLMGVPGEGYRFLPLSESPSEPAIPSAPWARQVLVDELGAQMAAGPGVWVLHGPGGVGKSWLAQTLLKQHGSGIFIDLSTSSDASEAEACVTVALDATGRAGWSTACEALGGALVVLDNTEQIQSIGAVVAALSGPRLRLMVTTRHRPDFEARTVSVAPLPREASRALLLERAELESTQVDAAMVDAVVDWLDGLPLAIELAARRLRLCSLAELHERLADRSDLLRDPGRPVRQQSLTAALRWSWELLSADARDALTACAVFRGSFELGAAEAVLGGADALEMLDHLAGASLVSRSPESGRFRLHGSVAGFVEEEAAPGVRSAAAKRHLAWYAGQARAWAAALRSQDSSMAWQRLDLERANLFAAFDAAVAASDPEAALSVSVALQPLLRTRGPTSRWTAVNESLVALTREVGDSLAGMARLHRGVQRLVGGDVFAAADDLRAALTAGRASQEPTLTALAAIRLAFVLGLGGEGDPAALLDEAHDLGVAHGLPRLQALALGDRGILAWRSSDFAEAERSFAKADRLFARIGDLVQRASTAVNRGHNARAFGNDELAAAYLSQGERLAERCRYRRVAAVAALELGDIAMLQGDLDRARDCFQRVIKHGEAIGSAELSGVVGVRLACVALASGQSALSELESALDILAGVDTQASEGGWLGLAIHAELLRRRGDPAAAGVRAMAEQAAVEPELRRALAHPGQRVPAAHLHRPDMMRWQWVVAQGI